MSDEFINNENNIPAESKLTQNNVETEAETKDKLENSALNRESEEVKTVHPERASQEEHKRPQFRHRDNRNGSKGQANTKYRRKVCRFCKNKDLKINYREASSLEGFITDRGKILPRRITGTCSKHQRELSRAIKRARTLSVLPFVVK